MVALSLDNRKSNNFGAYDICCGILLIYLTTSAFYIFKSGLPQPSNVLVLLGLCLLYVLQLNKPSFTISKINLTVLAIGSYTFCINMTYFAFHQDTQLFLSSLYYFYNAATFIFVSMLIIHKPDKAIPVIYYGVVIAICVQFILMMIDPSLRGSRATGTFFNPNQLSVWALIYAMILVTIRNYSTLKWYDFIFLLLVGYLQIMSVSKAGMICYTLLMGSLFFVRGINPYMKMIMILFGALLLIYGAFEASRLYSAVTSFDNVNYSLTKLSKIGQEGDENPTSRGYTRIMEYPHYLIIGAGEGAFERFTEQTKIREIHSGLGAFFFGYGFIGISLFLYFIYLVAKQNHWYISVLLFIYLLEGVVHQNVRFTDFWVMMGIMYGIGTVHHTQKRQKIHLPPNAGQEP